jgi:hypothetical protein
VKDQIVEAERFKVSRSQGVLTLGIAPDVT